MAVVRTFALLSIGAVALFMPFDLRTSPPEVLGPLVLVYALHVLPAASVLVLTIKLRTARRPERLAPLLVLTQALAADLYLVVSPGRAVLVAAALTCLLVSSSVLFAWAPWRVASLAAAAGAGFAITGTLARVPDVPFVLAFGVVLIGGAVAVACSNVLAGFRGELAAREQELQTLSRQLMSAQEEERRRLSRELHDELGQSLTAVSAYLWLAQRDLPAGADGARERVTEARRLVAKTLGEMRELSQLLCPPILALQGLVASLEAQLEAFRDRHGVATRFTVSGVSERLPADVETALYRITQEALTNVARHARAHAVKVGLVADDLELRLQIDDDGVGVPVRHGKAVATGTGLLGISERARALGGTVSISSRQGTHLCVRVPRTPTPARRAAAERRRAHATSRRIAPAAASILGSAILVPK